MQAHSPLLIRSNACSHTLSPHVCRHMLRHAQLSKSAKACRYTLGSWRADTCAHALHSWCRQMNKETHKALNMCRYMHTHAQLSRHMQGHTQRWTQETEWRYTLRSQNMPTNAQLSCHMQTTHPQLSPPCANTNCVPTPCAKPLAVPNPVQNTWKPRTLCKWNCSPAHCAKCVVCMSSRAECVSSFSFLCSKVWVWFEEMACIFIKFPVERAESVSACVSRDEDVLGMCSLHISRAECVSSFSFMCQELSACLQVPSCTSRAKRRVSSACASRDERVSSLSFLLCWELCVACVIASLSLTVGSRVYDYRVACVIASLSLTVGSRVYYYRVALLESGSWHANI
jgi:hypothetical protein